MNRWPETTIPVKVETNFKRLQALKSWLFNSWPVLEEVNLALYTVNQIGLVGYKFVTCMSVAVLDSKSNAGIRTMPGERRLH